MLQKNGGEKKRKKKRLACGINHKFPRTSNQHSQVCVSRLPQKYPVVTSCGWENTSSQGLMVKQRKIIQNYYYCLREISVISPQRRKAQT